MKKIIGGTAFLILWWIFVLTNDFLPRLILSFIIGWGLGHIVAQGVIEILEKRREKKQKESLERIAELWNK